MQDSVQQVLRRVMRHPLGLVGSGRTDSGVHAVGHVSSFHTSSPIECSKLKHAIGFRLPDDISLVDIRDVHPNFHATRSAISKLYRYRIHNAEARAVELLTHRYTYHFWDPLDMDRMREAAKYFVGKQDFAAMAANGDRRETTIRTVFRCDIERHSNEIRIDVEGDGFLYKQVRTMVGTLMSVGRGHHPPAWVAEVLTSKDRTRAGPTAPAHGLCLQWVKYPPELLSLPTETANAE